MDGWVRVLFLYARLLRAAQTNHILFSPHFPPLSIIQRKAKHRPLLAYIYYRIIIIIIIILKKNLKVCRPVNCWELGRRRRENREIGTTTEERGKGMEVESGKRKKCWLGLAQQQQTNKQQTKNQSTTQCLFGGWQK
jgi:hypothetical protein